MTGSQPSPWLRDQALTSPLIAPVVVTKASRSVYRTAALLIAAVLASALLLWITASRSVTDVHSTVDAGNESPLQPDVGSPSSAFACSPSTTVHVIFGNHLDIGFRAYSPEGFFAANVVDQAINQWFAMAVREHAAMQALPPERNPHNDSYIWTTHSWLLSLALDCPPHMNFSCISESDRDGLLAAITAGAVQWHAFPFNSEAEGHDAQLFEYGITMSQWLARRTGKVGGVPRVISQRDVPGTTKAVIPIMVRNGVRGFSIGANAAAHPAGVPATAFRWRLHPGDDENEIIVFYHPGDYGGIEYHDAVIIDGFPHVALFDWNGDNAGPKSAAAVLQDLEHVRGQFPNCTVRSSTFDTFMDLLWAAVRNGSVKLPVSTDEMGDTWVYGTSSDPIKVPKYRALQRLRTACIADSSCDSASPAFHNFSRLLLKGGEHTWGADVKSVFRVDESAGFIANGSYYQWSNKLLHAALARPDYQLLRETWREQRRWVVDVPLSALPASHPIAVGAVKEFAALQPQPVDLSGYTAIGDHRGGNFTHGSWTVGIGSDGAINELSNADLGRSWAGPGDNGRIGQLLYQAWTEQDVDNFLQEYCYIAPVQWVLYDYGKAFLDTVVRPNMTRHEPAVLMQAYVQSSPHQDSVSFIVRTTLPGYTVAEYGGWREAYALYTLDTAAGNVSITLTLHNKTATRIPESPSFLFSYPKPAWPLVDKLGVMVDTGRVMTGGGKHLHGVGEGGVHVNGWARVSSPDITMVGLAKPSAFPTPLQINSTSDFFFSLFDNTWGTNYPEWFPFEPEDATIQYRFLMQLL